MSLFILLVFSAILFSLELVYFKIARKYKIIDCPNHRSSHNEVTIRGGGIIFPIALLFCAFYWGFEYVYFLLGLLLISLISFLDDLHTIGSKLRFTFQVLAVALLFYQTGLYYLPFYWIIIALIFATGTINAINFMDGINGITGGYGLVTLITMYYINKYIVAYTDENNLAISIISVLIFNFFNFRVKAKCFAGDVGSISLAFIILFFLLQLIIKTNNLNFLSLLLIYGLDTVTTILFRIIRKENIVEAHRSHFYQFLVNERNMPHLLVAGLYMLVQVIINIILIKYFIASEYNLIFVMMFPIVIFVLIRILMEGPRKLFVLNK